MSTIKSSSANLTLNADGANNDIKFQSNAVEKASIDQDGNLVLSGTLTSLGVDDNCTATKLTVSDSGININGDITFSSASQGICLGVTSNTDANTLDDYEEGTWTPTLTCSTSGSYVTDTGSNLLAYTKVGRVVHIQGGFQAASESSPNGNLRISLPFTPFDSTKDTDYSMGNATLTSHGGTLANNTNMFISGGVTWASLYSVADDGTTQYIDHNDVDTAFGIQFSMTYIAA
jgi:hypothetical protein